MSINTHAERRAWTFSALDEIEEFLEDPDFEGDDETERAAIERKRRELREGKYRVVFLGAYNVGKSALINAFLGDEYLPMILEECTTKITHILRAKEMKAVLNLTAPATQDELAELRELIAAAGVHAEVARVEEGPEVEVIYSGKSPRELLRSLNALVTVNAEDDFPQLRTLRRKFEEVTLHVPSTMLQDDIAFVDSPGVHSISQTHTKIAHEIIPHSHLVICLIESQNAGNTHNREFIEEIVKQRRRKVLFVINKADQLNEEEVDPQGHRGPAKDLYRSLEGVVDNPELFFVSSLYALIAAHLSAGRMDLDELDQNRKIKIPFGVQRELLATDTPEQGAADFLMKQSGVPELKHRLLDYLYTENREVAIVESVARFIDTMAWKLARPLEVRLELARNIPRLDELAEERTTLNRQIDEVQSRGQEVRGAFRTMSEGGRIDGVSYRGYAGMVDDKLDDSNVREKVLEPLKKWLRNDDNLRTAKAREFEPLLTQIASTIDGFRRDVQIDINREVETIEHRVIDLDRSILKDVTGTEKSLAETSRGGIEPIQVSLAGSYFGYSIAGLLIGAVAGAGIAAAISGGGDPAALGLGGAVGAAAGLIIGLIARASTANRVIRERLDGMVAERVAKILHQGARGDGGSEAQSVEAQLKEGLESRKRQYAASLDAAFNEALEDLQAKLRDVEDEEARIKKEQEEVIARLEPKVQKLMGLGQNAGEIAESSVEREPESTVAAFSGDTSETEDGPTDPEHPRGFSLLPSAEAGD